jgi:hypothetical protein
MDKMYRARIEAAYVAASHIFSAAHDTLVAHDTADNLAAYLDARRAKTAAWADLTSLASPLFCGRDVRDAQNA